MGEEKRGGLLEESSTAVENPHSLRQIPRHGRTESTPQTKPRILQFGMSRGIKNKSIASTDYNNSRYVTRSPTLGSSQIDAQGV